MNPHERLLGYKPNVTIVSYISTWSSPARCIQRFTPWGRNRRFVFWPLLMLMFRGETTNIWRFPKIGGYPNSWMVYGLWIMENPSYKWMIYIGVPPWMETSLGIRIHPNSRTSAALCTTAHFFKGFVGDFSLAKVRMRPWYAVVTSVNEDITFLVSQR